MKSENEVRDEMAEADCVWYCPECDGLFVLRRNFGFLFKGENGPFIKVWERGGDLTLHDLYLIGEL